jgi:hypothetical protein
MSRPSSREFDERVRILRRYREALVRQRDRFRSYLDALERRPTAEDPTAELEFHVEMEASIVREISVFERSIEPLETLYRVHDPKGAGEIPSLREALTRTRDEVLRRTEQNQLSLRRQIDAIRQEISSLKVVRSRRLTIAGSTPQPSLVDINA